MPFNDLTRCFKNITGQNFIAFSLILCAWLFLTSSSFTSPNDSFLTFALISLALIILYTAFEYFFYSENPTVHPSYTVTFNNEVATDLVEDNNADLEDDRTQSTLNLCENNIIQAQPMSFGLHSFLPPVIYLSGAFMFSFGSQMLISDCFKVAHSAYGIISTSLVGMAGMFVAGGYQYLPERVRRSCHFGHCVASLLGVICWMMAKAPVDAINDTAKYTSVYANAFTSLASTALTLYAVGSPDILADMSNTPRQHVFSRFGKRIILFGAHSFIWLGIYLFSAPSFSELLNNNISSGWAVAARVLWAVGLTGATSLLITAFHSSLNATCVPQLFQDKSILVSALPAYLGMTVRLILNTDWCHTVLVSTVQLIGGLTVPVAALIIPLMSVAAKRLPRIRFRMLAGASAFYIGASVIAFILLSVQHVYNFSPQSSSVNNRLFVPQLPRTANGTPLYPYESTLYSGINESERSMPWQVADKLEFQVEPPRVSHIRENCDIYTNLLRKIHSNSFCGVEPAETLFDHCQPLYFLPRMDIAVFKHPKIGFLAIIDLREAHHVLDDSLNPQDHEFLKRATSNMIGYVNAEQYEALIRLRTPKDIEYLLKTHLRIENTHRHDRKMLGICTVSSKDNVYNVLLQPSLHISILYTFTEQPNAIFKIEATEYIVGDQCIGPYMMHLLKRPLCSDTKETLSNTCMLFEKTDSAFDLAFQDDKLEWLFQSVDLNEIIHQNNNASLGGGGFKLVNAMILKPQANTQFEDSRLNLINETLLSAIWRQRKSHSLSACSVKPTLTPSKHLMLRLNNGQRYLAIVTRKGYKEQLVVTIFNKTDTAMPFSEQDGDANNSTSSGISLP